MTRTARRIASAAVPAVTALVSVVALGTPAHAAVEASVSWNSTDDSATIQLNQDAVNAAVAYDFGLGWGVVDMCGQINAYVNGKRQAAGYATGLQQRDCMAFVQDCVKTRQDNSVQITVTADLLHYCGSYG